MSMDKPDRRPEYHKGCGGEVVMRNEMTALVWRCNRCRKPIPVSEATFTPPAKARPDCLRAGVRF